MASETKQHRITEGLILREYPSIAENDRFVAILTRDAGLLRASARGAKKLHSRLGAGTQPLCYARLHLIPGRDKFIVEDARPMEVFFSLRQNVEKLALAQYFSELALHMTPIDAPAEEHLRLLLNGLHYLAQGSRDPLLVKAVVEGRLLCLEGYTPDLSGCCLCGHETGQLWFSPLEGTLFCNDCVRPSDALAVSPGVLAALRHVLYGEFGRCFAFSLPAGELRQLAQLVERFLLAQIPRRYPTLEFYHSVT